MRLASIGPYPPYRGGIAQFTSRLAAVLEKRARVLKAGYSRLYPKVLFPGSSQLEPGAVRPPASVTDIDSCNPLAWPGTRRAISSWRPDRIVIQWWHPFFAPSIHFSLPRRTEFPRAAICHNVLPHENFPLGKALAGRFLRSCRLLIVHGGRDELLARAAAPSARVLRLFHPIYDQYLPGAPTREESRARLGFSGSESVVLFFGLVRPYKGLEDLAEAVAGMAPEVRLLVAGECYAGQASLRERLSSADLAGRCTWIDRFVPDREVGLLFRAADLVALPYRQATQSGVAQIALAFGKPLVLTRTGGLADLVDEGRTGFLADPCSPEDLRRAIGRAMELARDPGAEGRILEFSRRFSWEAYADSLLEALG